MNIDEQVSYLMQGAEYGDENLYQTMAAELRQRLVESQETGRPLRVYCGYDPRTTDLHIGHTVTMRKLRQFQELGHDVFFVIGTYTSLIGDPSDTDKLRAQLTPQQAQENARSYAEQAFRVLDRQKTHIRFNDEWLSKLAFAELIRIASLFTIQQFLARENFRQRWERGDAVYLHETFYSIMQGYDAHVLQADVQVGGTDQLFNIVTAARKVMAYLGSRPNIAIIMGILPGTDGVVKMSKSLANHIPLNSSPEDMYGKVMSIPDQAMGAYFRLVTRWPPEKIAEIEQDLANGAVHPRDAKMELARQVVEVYYGPDEARQAEQAFVRVFQKGEQPAEMEAYPYEAGRSLLDVLVESGLVKTRSEGRRLVAQKGVRLDGELLTEANLPLPHPGILQAGKRRFLQVRQGGALPEG